MIFAIPPLCCRSPGALWGEKSRRGIVGRAWVVVMVLIVVVVRRLQAVIGGRLNLRRSVPATLSFIYNIPGAAVACHTLGTLQETHNSRPCVPCVLKRILSLMLRPCSRQSPVHDVPHGIIFPPSWSFTHFEVVAVTGTAFLPRLAASSSPFTLPASLHPCLPLSTSTQ
ncbi:hypothetical protein E2C01_011439 [Portunus trituberculatus]|uniref:Uncharacterized protein n=1 Tax=Portunus trituberculatus TaxID=210409 RepID=A0A5B7DB71_PORTR|nr:hypothetical protein [Portunus trituberculatus]